MIEEAIKKARRLINRQNDGYCSISSVVLGSLQNLILVIEELQKEKKEITERAAIIILSGPCQDHIDESLEDFDAFREKVSGKCLMCVINENEELSKHRNKHNTNIQDSL
jgi:hypothetical protein